TQYFTSPLTLNPALTGLTRCDLRMAANYRSQWGSVSPHPYVTGTVSYDMATLKGSLPEGDALGIGLLGLFDKSGSGALQNTTVGLSVAYHKSFGQEKQNTISFGVQGFLVQKSIDFNKLTFEDQFDPSTGTTINVTGETFANADLTYPDFNAGLMYTGRLSDYSTAYVGVSYYHIAEPTESFLGGNHTIAPRISATIGGSFDLNENMVLYASGLYQQQAKASELVVGAAAGIVLNLGYDEEFSQKTVFYLGSWYRS